MIWVATCAAPLLYASQEPGRVVIREASGIIRSGDKLLVVADDADGRYFELVLPADEADVIPFDPAKVREVLLPGAEMALDLESLDRLSDGRVAFLSEQSRCLIAEYPGRSGRYAVIAEYDRTVAELGGRGLEGVAVTAGSDGASRIAVLWEGGYLEPRDVTSQLRGDICGKAMKPVILVHDLEAGGKAGLVRNPSLRIQLEVPTPEGDPPLAQRFRAADLVWHTPAGEGGDGQFIVLISSSNAPPAGSPKRVRYQFKFLQRFGTDGRPIGEPLDLKDVCCRALDQLEEKGTAGMGSEMSSHVREARDLLERYGWENVNWEGLGWFVEGERLITIYDAVPKDPPFAVIFDIPEDWK